MSARRLDDVVAAAIREGLLPAGVTAPAGGAERPWPVVLLTALGAWLAAIPLLGVVGLLLGDIISRSVGPYVVGVLLLAASIVVLRSRSLPLFVEQLAVPGLLVGGGGLGFGLMRDLGFNAGAAALALVALGVAAVLSAGWLRALLGAAGAVLLAASMVPERHLFQGPALVRWWWAMHAVLAAWMAARLFQQRGAHAAAAAALEPIAAGWLLALLAGLAWWAGMTFLVGAAAGGGFGGMVVRELGSRAAGSPSSAVPQAVSAGLALAAAAWAARCWPGLRRTWAAGAAAVLIALAGFMPTLGATWLVLAACATSRRWRLAGCAALAAAWIIGAFYYSLGWPLGTKAAVLAGAGAVLGLLAGWGLALERTAAAAGAGAGAGVGVGVGGVAPPAQPEGPAAGPLARWGALAGLGASVVLVLAVANIGIWQKEALIRDGRPVFVELAPVDPRSLMQGDFMRLNFRLPAIEVRSRGGGGEPDRGVGEEAEVASLLWGRRLIAVMRIDERGVARPLRVVERIAAAPAADEVHIELTPKNGNWTLVTDAWFFQEGQGARYERARYGEFRVEPGGRALLVGLRGEKLEPL